MTNEEIKQIKLRRGSVGIAGLPGLLEQARSRSFSSDDELKEFLLQGVRDRNFVARGTEDEYKEALFREYRRFVGDPLPEEACGALEIRILGPGCPRCRALEQATMQAVAELNVAADVQHVKNLTEIAQYGILATPGLVINGEVRSSGKVLSKEQIKTLISAAMEG